MPNLITYTIFMFTQSFWFPVTEIFSLKNTQRERLCNLLLKNKCNISKTTHDLDKVVFNFSS